jgi:hypothetical protein
MRLFIFALVIAMLTGIVLRNRPDLMRYTIAGLTVLVTVGYYFFRQI